MAETEIGSNIARVRARIAEAAARTGRQAAEITLVAVSKTVPVERIMEAYHAGIRDFGENYVQESLPKQADPLLGGLDVQWHFIGHLQSNKVREVVGKFALIQSVDSISLAHEIARRAQRIGYAIPILLEVKLDPAQTKFGFVPDSLLEMATRIASFPLLELRGLMGMAPFGDDPEQARPYFRRLYSLFRQLPAAAQQTLSMGMTGDFEVAIEEGATLVRLGTAIFGKRPL